MPRNKTRARRYGFVERTADGPVWVSTNQVGVFVRRPATGEEASRAPEIIEAPPPPISKELKRLWGYSISRVYETDSLLGPKTSWEMRIISFIPYELHPA